MTMSYIQNQIEVSFSISFIYLIFYGKSVKVLH